MGRAMTATPATIENRVDPIDVLELRAWARAYLWSIGELTRREAVDVLQHDAERDGLVDEIGQDGVQKILSAAFAPFREAAP
jgi:hypothetical protein